MDIKEKLSNFNKRWSFEDVSSYEEEFEKFKKRVLNIFSDVDNHVTEEGIKQFCQILGITEKWQYLTFDRKQSKNIVSALVQEDNEKNFYRLLQIISFLPIRTSVAIGVGATSYSRQKLFRQLGEAIDFSNVNLAMVVENEEVVFRPKGESKFDEILVDQVVSFLNPASQKHFINALELSLNFSPENSVKSAESLRRSLEEFLRYKLKNQQGLDKNIQELGKKMKEDGRDSVIRNIVFQNFSLLDQYFNENSKHKDGDINEVENELLIYQTGVLMRYLEKSV